MLGAKDGLNSNPFHTPMLSEKENKIKLAALVEGNKNVLNFVRPHPYRIGNKPTSMITMASDSEYKQRVNQVNLMITTQPSFSSNSSDCYVFEHPDLGLGLEPTWNGKSLFSTLIGWSEIELSKSRSQSPSVYDVSAILVLEVLVFFAPADVLRALFDVETCKHIQKHLRQDGRMRIESGERRHPDILILPVYLNAPIGYVRLALKIVDLSRIAAGNLETVALSFGLKMPSKRLMDHYKKDMLVPYQDPTLHPVYIKYSKPDSTILFPLREANMERERMLYAVHGLVPDGVEKLTIGRTVENLFVAFIDKYIGEYCAYKFFKTKGLNSEVQDYSLRDLLHDSSLDHFATIKDSTEAVLGVVAGGMAKNMRPTEFKSEGVIADADYQSGYVTIQCTMNYPVGIPFSWGRHKNDITTSKTLGQFLKEHGSELVDRGYVIFVSGKLSHHQSLVPSKVIDAVEISEKYDPDSAKIPAEFRFYSHELINSPLTSDTLQCLKNVCSDREWSEWEKLEVVSAAWYPRSKMCHTPEEWFEKTKAHVEEHGNEIVKKIIKGKPVEIDNRSHYWLAIPIVVFLQPYADERKRLKAELKLTIKGTDEYLMFDAQQGSMKLSGNTLYGVGASLSFDVGNPVVSNSITGMMRTAAWCGAIASGGNVVITDGFPFNLNEVRDWSGDKKPSMNTLSLWRDLSLVNRKTRADLISYPLGNQGEWKLAPGRTEGEDQYSILSNDVVSWERKAGGWTELNEMLKAHVVHFFRPTGTKPEIQCLTEMSFDIKDVYTKALFRSQTDYQFHHVNEGVKPLTKARGSGGFDLNSDDSFKYENGKEQSRILDFFTDLDQNPHAIPPYEPQTFSQIVKCDDANRRYDSASDNVVKDNGLFAGDSTEHVFWLRPISLSGFFWQDHAQFVSWDKTNEWLKEKSGYGMEQFFLNPDGTLDYARALKEIQAAIDEGKQWIVPAGGRGNSKKTIHHVHPHFTPFK
ncbi:hypothetical protein LEP3755_33970 [Leptolyngbya sp. NIES-3755]|nr:hypothetical protein LEP3755_33970 [Leptolyngbya sp. NIES-3755]